MSLSFEQIEKTDFGNIAVPIYRFHNSCCEGEEKDIWDPDFQEDFFIDLKSIEEYIYYELRDDEMLRDVQAGIEEFPYVKRISLEKEDIFCQYTIEKLDACISAKEILTVLRLANNPSLYYISSYDIHVCAPDEPNYRCETFDFEICTLFPSEYKQQFYEALKEIPYFNQKDIYGLTEKILKEDFYKTEINGCLVESSRVHFFPVFRETLVRVGNDILQK